MSSVPGFILIFPVCVSLVPDTQLCVCCTRGSVFCYFSDESQKTCVSCSFSTLMSTGSSKGQATRAEFSHILGSCLYDRKATAVNSTVLQDLAKAFYRVSCSNS